LRMQSEEEESIHTTTASPHLSADQLDLYH
jgi:hypothetical protein